MVASDGGELMGCFAEGGTRGILDAVLHCCPPSLGLHQKRGFCFGNCSWTAARLARLLATRRSPQLKTIAPKPRPHAYRSCHDSE